MVASSKRVQKDSESLVSMVGRSVGMHSGLPVRGPEIYRRGRGNRLVLPFEIHLLEKNTTNE